ncbi:DUF6185 family protein [Streptomyces toxytricini]|uniref:DUF6185 family protein n=1 Tax=Streptomyces toxytricini TaxID=67369 RepID=A0ABW8ER02_STRT5
MTQLRRSALILLHILLLTLPALATAAAPAYAAPAKSCRPDQLKSATVKAGAEFTHRGTDHSMLRSTMDISVPVAWEHASDLLLDSHSPDHRFALRCLVGKAPIEGNMEGLDYDEWRLKPLVVKAYEKHVAVHYEAVTWIDTLDPYRVGPWILTPEDGEWLISLQAPANIAGARWDEVYLRLGGPGALSATPPPEFGEGGTVLTWRGEQPAPAVRVTLHPPAAQYWNAVAYSRHQAWEIWGLWGASGAFWYVATAVLLLAVGNRLQGGLARRLMPQEAYSLRVLRAWALLMLVFSLLVYLGDNAYRHVARMLAFDRDYEAAVALFTLALLGLALCAFGGLKKQVLAAVGAFLLALLVLSVTSEYFELPILPTADLITPLESHWVVSVLYTATIAVCCLGMIASGERLLLMGERRLPTSVMVAVATAAALMTTLWAYLAISRSWERVSWLLEPGGREQAPLWEWWLDDEWWQLPSGALDSLLTIAAVLAPLALVGVLRVFRTERFQAASFTPTQSESFLLVSLFGIAAADDVRYFGFSGYLLELLLVLVAAWGVVALGSRLSVLGKISVDDAPLGSIISQTDRSDVLRLARHFRELQSRLHRLSADAPSEQTAAQEAIEAEIDRLDRALPEGVRPADLPFACGPMATWWENACRGAAIACFVGLPATGLMYWQETVRGDYWVFWTEEASGFLAILSIILSWHFAWVMGGFFLGALWRSLPGRHGPAKACCVAAVFAVPVTASYIIVRAIGQDEMGVVGVIATFTSVMTLTGFVMDVQTFRGERRYLPTNASLVAYVYQMRIASVAFFLAQIVALATIWKTFQGGGPSGPAAGP